MPSRNLRVSVEPKGFKELAKQSEQLEKKLASTAGAVRSFNTAFDGFGRKSVTFGKNVSQISAEVANLKSAISGISKISAPIVSSEKVKSFTGSIREATSAVKSLTDAKKQSSLTPINGSGAKASSAVAEVKKVQAAVKELEKTKKAAAQTEAVESQKTINIKAKELAAIRAAAREKNAIAKSQAQNEKIVTEAARAAAAERQKIRTQELASIRKKAREANAAASSPIAATLKAIPSSQRGAGTNAELAKIAREAREATGATNDFARASTNAARKSSQFSGSISNTRKNLFDFVNIAKVAAGNLIAIFTTELVFGARRFAGNIVNATSTLQDFANKIRLVTKENESLAETQKSLFNLAVETRSSLGGTIELYTRLARSTENLGLSQERLLRITETVNKATIISGATAREAEQGLIQLGQAIASNRLGGDEFRSVSEQLPEISRIIADSLGVTRGELRKLAEEGKLTADVLVNAFESAGDRIDSEFSSIDITIGQAFTNLETTALERLSQDVEKISSVVISLITLVENNIDNIIEAFKTLAQVVGLLAANFAAVRLATFIGQVTAASKALAITTAFFSGSTRAINGFTIASVTAQRAVAGFSAVLLANPVTAVTLAVFGLVKAFEALEKRVRSISGPTKGSIKEIISEVKELSEEILNIPDIDISTNISQGELFNLSINPIIGTEGVQIDEEAIRKEILSAIPQKELNDILKLDVDFISDLESEISRLPEIIQSELTKTEIILDNSLVNGAKQREIISRQLQSFLTGELNAAKELKESVNEILNEDDFFDKLVDAGVLSEFSATTFADVDPFGEQATLIEAALASIIRASKDNQIERFAIEEATTRKVKKEAEERRKAQIDAIKASQDDAREIAASLESIGEVNAVLGLGIPEDEINNLFLSLEDSAGDLRESLEDFGNVKINTDFINELSEFFKTAGISAEFLEKKVQSLQDLARSETSFDFQVEDSAQESIEEFSEEITKLSSESDRIDLNNIIREFSRVKTEADLLKDSLEFISGLEDIKVDFQTSFNEDSDNIANEIALLKAEIEGGESAVIEVQAKIDTDESIKEFNEQFEETLKILSNISKSKTTAFGAIAKGILERIEKAKKEAKEYAEQRTIARIETDKEIAALEKTKELIEAQKGLVEDRIKLQKELQLLKDPSLSLSEIDAAIDVLSQIPGLTLEAAVAEGRKTDAIQKNIDLYREQKEIVEGIPKALDDSTKELGESISEIRRRLAQEKGELKAAISGGEIGTIAFRINSDIDNALANSIQPLQDAIDSIDRNSPKAEEAIRKLEEGIEVIQKIGKEEKTLSEIRAEEIITLQRMVNIAADFQNSFDNAFDLFFDQILRSPKDAFKSFANEIEDGFINLASDILRSFFDPVRDALRDIAKDITSSLFSEGGKFDLFGSIGKGIQGITDGFTKSFSKLPFVGPEAAAGLGLASSAALGGFAGFQAGKGISDLVGVKGNKSSNVAGGALGGLAGFGLTAGLGIGLTGAAAGGLAGGAAIGAVAGSVVPVVGTIIGAALGVVLSGVLSKPSDNIAQGVFNPLTGTIAGLGNETNKNVEPRDAFIEAITAFTTSITDTFGGSISDNPDTSFREDLLNVAVGSRDGTRVGFQGVNGEIANQFTFASTEEGIRQAAAKAAEITLRNLEGGNRAVIEFGISALEVTKDLERSNDSINKLSSALDFLNEPLSETAQRIKGVRDAIKPLIEEAQFDGNQAAVVDLTQQLNNALRAIRDNIIDEAEDAILAIESPIASNLKQLIETQGDRISDILELPEGFQGPALSVVDRLNTAELEQFIEQSASGINSIIESLNPFRTNETLDSILEFTDTFDVLADAASEASGKIKDNIEKIIGELQGTLDELATSFNLGISNEILGFENPEALQLRQILGEQGQSLEIADEIGADVNQVLQLTALRIGELIESASSSPESLINLAEGLTMLIAEMEAAGQAIGPVIDAFSQAQIAIVKELNDGFTDRILEITQPNLQAFRSLLGAQKAELEIAQQLGADVLLLVQAQTLERQKFLDSLSDAELSELGDFLGLIEDFTGKISVVSAELNTSITKQLEGIEELRDSIEETVDSYTEIADTIRSTIQSIEERFNLGVPGERLANLRQSFQSTLESARLGDVSSLERLPEIGSSIIDLSRELFGGTVSFQNDLDLVLGALNEAETIAIRNAENEQERLEAIIEQRDLLREIRDILSTEDTEAQELTDILNQLNPLNSEVVSSLTELINLITGQTFNFGEVSDFLSTDSGAQESVDQLFRSAGLISPSEASSNEISSSGTVSSAIETAIQSNSGSIDTGEAVLASNEILSDKIDTMIGLLRTSNVTNTDSRRELRRIRDVVKKDADENQTIQINLLRGIKENTD